MSYFDDISFINAAIIPDCDAEMDRNFPDSWSIEFILSGKMYYGIDNGAKVIVDQPAIFWHSPKHSYQYGAVDKNGWLHHWILFQGGRGRHLIEDGFDKLSSNGMVYVKNSQSFADIFRLLVPMVKQGFPRNHAHAVLLLEKMYVMLLDEQLCSGENRLSYQIEDVATRLESFPMESYDFHAEAKKLGLSYSRFRTVFRQQFGFPPHDYLLRCRMRHSAQLLEDPDSQVKNVAYECGFDDPAQFSRLFKKKIGVSPKYYQQSIPR